MDSIKNIVMQEVIMEHTDTTAIERFMFDNDVVMDAGSSGLALMVLCILLGLCLFQSNWRRWIFRHLKWIAGSVLVAGILIYMIGFNYEGSRNNLLVLFLRALVASLEMFVSESELIEVCSDMKESRM